MMGIWKLLIGAVSITVILPLASGAGELQPATKKAWDDYISLAALRTQDRLSAGHSFLWIDESADRMVRVRRGEVVVAPEIGRGTQDVPDGLIHDWIGAIFIPNTTVKRLVAVVHDYDHYKQVYKPVVTDSKLLACTSTDEAFSMIWQRRVLFVNAALSGRYRAHDVALDEHRGYNVADTVQVQEIADYGRPHEHLLPVDTGSGFIWRLHSISRYAERDGGVYLELEVIALTRDIPSSLRWLVNPVVNHLSTNSLMTTLRQTREAVNSFPEKLGHVATCEDRDHNSLTAALGGRE